MDEELFNISIRKFLKHFGVTAQREIERAVREGIEDGTLRGSETIPVHATLTIDGLLVDFRVHCTLFRKRRVNDVTRSLVELEAIVRNRICKLCSDRTVEGECGLE